MTLIAVGGKLTPVAGKAGIGTVINGNSKSYAANPWSAHTSMWGTGVPGNDQLVANSSITVVPENFPTGTVFNWDIVPDPDYSGVNGYLHLDYGNYDWSPGTITSRQVYTITNLTVDIGWSYQGDPASGLLSECWLSAAAAPTGDYAKTHEIAFFPKNSANSSAYLNSLPAVGAGSFTDSNGVVWNVKQGISGVGSVPYLIAFRPGHADFQGKLPYKDFFVFLHASGKITGNEWFNGVAFGVEPHHGSGSLTINKMGITYVGGGTTPWPAPAQNVITDGIFALDDAKWAGSWYSGKTIQGGQANFNNSPAYDGFTQAVSVQAGKYYELKWTIKNYSSGNVYPYLSGGTQRAGVRRNANGTYTERLLVNTGNNVFGFMSETGACTLSVDDISLTGPYNTATVGGS